MPNVSKQPEWKMVLAEGNAAGWIGLIVLVIAIGAGTLFFSNPRPHPVRPAIVATHAVR